MTKKEREIYNKLARLIQENPDLPLLPLVDADVVAGNYIQKWAGYISDVHIEDTLDDLAGEIALRREIESDDDIDEDMYDLMRRYMGMNEKAEWRVNLLVSFEDVKNVYLNLPWERAIVIDIKPLEEIEQRLYLIKAVK